jgi:hypothetical protein
MGSARVQRAATALATELEALGIPYAIAGGLAVTAHGHERTTADVDVLLTADGLRAFKEHCLGRGWVERFPGSKGMRDVENNVKVDVLVTGDYPGDGKPKPVRFPDPALVAVPVGGLDAMAVDLATLIELKLASGLTAPDRPRDFDDVIQLVRKNRLPEWFADRLNPWVREKFVELWRYAQLPSEDD